MFSTLPPTNQSHPLRVSLRHSAATSSDVGSFSLLSFLLCVRLNATVYNYGPKETSNADSDKKKFFLVGNEDIVKFAFCLLRATQRDAAARWFKSFFTKIKKSSFSSFVTVSFGSGCGTAVRALAYQSKVCGFVSRSDPGFFLLLLYFPF